MSTRTPHPPVSSPAFLHPGRLPGLLLALALLGGVGCGSSGPPVPAYSAATIQSAEQAGNLESLHAEIVARLADPKLDEEDRVRLEAARDDVGRRIAAGLERSLQAELDGQRLDSGLVPLPAYATLSTQLEAIRGWDAATGQRLASALEAGGRETREAIAAREGELVAATGRARMDLYRELIALSGARSIEGLRWASERDAYVDELARSADEAIARESYDDAQALLAVAAEARPNDAAIEGRRGQVDARIFEQQFFEALESGDPDAAYEALVTMSESEDFARVRPNLQESADVMADYFAAAAAGATGESNYVDAYRWFEQSRDVRARLGMDAPKEVSEAGPFVEEMRRRYGVARERELHGLAWGYLNVVSDLQPSSPGLLRDLRETRELVLQKAIKRLSASDFRDTHSGPEYGDTVGARVVQYLFENLTEDVRIIERDQLEAIQRERELGGGKQALVSADYLIEGTINEAKVESSEKIGRRTRRVETGSAMVPNPDYDRWKSMSQSQRKKEGLTTPPPATIRTANVEDITIEVTHHRKVGILSVSYRVIDAESAKVIFADSLRKTVEHEDTSSDEVDVGSFKLEFKVADLPSDVEILNELADQASNEVGAELAKVLANPERKYAEDAERFVREGNHVDASQQYASALVLAARKDADVTELRGELKRSTVAASLD